MADSSARPSEVMGKTRSRSSHLPGILLIFKTCQWPALSCWSRNARWSWASATMVPGYFATSFTTICFWGIPVSSAMILRAKSVFTLLEHAANRHAKTSKSRILFFTRSSTSLLLPSKLEGPGKHHRQFRNRQS